MMRKIRVIIKYTVITMLGWLWDLLVSFFTFLTGLLGLKKKSVSFADESAGGASGTGVVASVDEKKEEVVAVELVKD
jgi:hypothetical protein